MASFFCLNASTTEIERNSVLRSFAWLAWHTGTLPRDLCGFVREVIFRQDFSDAIGRFRVSRADERNWKEDAWDVSVQHDEEARTDDACIGGGMWDVASDAAQKEVWRC